MQLYNYNYMQIAVVAEQGTVWARCWLMLTTKLSSVTEGRQLR